MCVGVLVFWGGDQFCAIIAYEVKNYGVTNYGDTPLYSPHPPSKRACRAWFFVGAGRIEHDAGDKSNGR
jgi:hypothetical protein